MKNFQSVSMVKSNPETFIFVMLISISKSFFSSEM